MPRLAGSVHGVVVQMTMEALSVSPPVTMGNFTNTAGETLSAYSTSASARAVCAPYDHCTGFLDW